MLTWKTMPPYQKKIINMLNIYFKSMEWKEYSVQRTDLEKKTKELLILANVDINKLYAKYDWDNTKFITRYNLAFGFCLELLVKETLINHNFKCSFNNGSKETIISTDSKTFKNFDILIWGNFLSAGADIKSVTLWRANDIVPDGTWIVNKGLTLNKLLEIKRWGKRKKKKPLLIVCIPELQAADPLDMIFVIDISKIVYSHRNDKLFIPVDNKKWIANPLDNEDHEYYQDSILMNINTENSAVTPIKTFINRYHPNLRLKKTDVIATDSPLILSLI